ncbi:MAG: hypothetical protein AVO35_09045 [Candidatus Aegiribacteria sp. MLS_C]|nr:MAG: hypothetical protein AVO35_09045 [Candidatus Aegiribacteria sp. MLS_C]
MMDQYSLEALARRIARNMGPGSRLYLTGDLGAGKSVFARAALRELGVRGDIPSPSFIVDAVYSCGKLVIHHLDLYRLEGDPDELEFYGIDEILASDSLVIVEWADRLNSSLLIEGTRVHIEFSERHDMREVTVDGRTVAGD